ncbi:MAG: hypothetical protein M1608_17505, partial [Candidatus Omnitrophica bacterium]|nr:hypothetical protein [Candidatus Omnitrophota bacterium]
NRHARTSRRHFLIVLAGCGMPALLHSDESRDNHSSALPGFDCFAGGVRMVSNGQRRVAMESGGRAA